MLLPVSRSIAIITNALDNQSITRTEYNYVRRCVALFDDNQTNQWLRLADALWDQRISIVEDGDTIFDAVEVSYER